MDAFNFRNSRSQRSLRHGQEPDGSGSTDSAKHTGAVFRDEEGKEACTK